jgi:hypothetical protein
MRRISRALTIVFSFTFLALLSSPAGATSTATVNPTPLIDRCHTTPAPAGYFSHQQFTGTNPCQKCIDAGRVFERQGYAAHCYWPITTLRVELWLRRLG